MSGLAEALEAARASVDRLEREKVHALRRFEELIESKKALSARVVWLEAKITALEAELKKARLQK